MAASKEITRYVTTYVKLPDPDPAEHRSIPAAPSNIVQDPAYSNNTANVTSVTITWDDSATNTISHYNLLLDSDLAGQAVVGDETFTFSGLVAGSNHVAHIEAVNTLGIASDRWQLAVQVSEDLTP